MGLSGSAIISGVADLPSTAGDDGRTALALTVEVARSLLDDAGLQKGEVDGLLITTPFDEYSMLWPSVVAEALGLSLRYMDTVELGGASSAGMVWRAAAAIDAGMCEHVLCISVDARSGVANPWRTLLPRHDDEHETPYGATPPNAHYAMIARRHMHDHGTTAEQLARIAVDQRRNALLTPHALFNRQPIGIDDVLASKLICDPLHLLEIVRPCSGGGGVVVSRRRAARGSHPPVAIVGAGEAGAHVTLTSRPSITQGWARQSAKRAFAMAGLAPRDIDVAQLYDCYTIAVLILIEELGFCPAGQGGAFIAEHGLVHDGGFPCNTNGGQLSFGQPGGGGGMILVVEGARQLMGRAGDRQVKGARHGLVQGNGGVMAEEVTLILSNAA